MSRPEPTSFGATLRFELASDEGRPLFVSYVVASFLALAWLTLVQMLPSPVGPGRVMPEPPVITWMPEPPLLTPPSTRGRTGDATRSVPSTAPGAGSFRGMFSGNTGLVDAGNLLRGVDVTATGHGVSETARQKVGLGTGVGSRTPGISGSGGFSATKAGVGAVTGNGVSRKVVSIAPPEVLPIGGAAPGGNVSEVGQVARTNVPQLARCYQEEGLTRNASLAGLVRLAITVEGGRVTTAQIVDRSWVGAGVAETESCLVRAVRGWQLGSSNARIVLPLSFTSPGRVPR